MARRKSIFQKEMKSPKFKAIYKEIAMKLNIGEKVDEWDKIRKIWRNIHPIRYKIQQIMIKIKEINLLDLIGATIILVSLYLITIDPLFWLLYASGCMIYAVVLFKKKLFFGVIMNGVAMIIAIVNYIRSLL